MWPHLGVERSPDGIGVHPDREGRARKRVEFGERGGIVQHVLTLILHNSSWTSAQVVVEIRRQRTVHVAAEKPIARLGQFQRLVEEVAQERLVWGIAQLRRRAPHRPGHPPRARPLVGHGHVDHMAAPRAVNTLEKEILPFAKRPAVDPGEHHMHYPTDFQNPTPV